MDMKSRLAALRHGLKKTNPRIASALLGALAFAFVLGFYAFRSVLFPAHQETTPAAAEAPKFRHPLTGALVDKEVPEEPQVFAVMIDHSSDAWPQSGIDAAFLVFEAPVEGGIPRLMALFNADADAEIDQIGPVRSARPYFVEWAKEFDAMYAHVGGSDAALDLIETGGTFDLNQFWNAAAFWRSAKRFAPHNVYSSTALLKKAYAVAVEKDRAPERLYGRWEFKDPAAQADRPLEGVDATLDFLGKTYQVDWLFDEASGRYERRQSGLPYVMDDKSRVYADNVATVLTEMEVVDAVGRREVRTIGEGTAYVFQDGKVVRATWKKPSVAERLAFYDEDGKAIPMNAGTTWIEVLERDGQVKFSGKN
jgi:hypothetical protein